MADLRAQIEAARSAGYSDAEIATFLAGRDQRVKQALDAQYSPAEVLQFLTAQPAASATRTAPTAVAPTPAPALPPAAEALRQASVIPSEVQAQRDTNALPILQQELQKAQQRTEAAQQAAANNQPGAPEALARAQADVDAVSREISRMQNVRVSAAPQQPAPALPPTAPQIVAEVPAAIQPVAAVPTAGRAVAPPALPPRPPSVIDQIRRQLGLTARAGAEGVAGGFGIFTDPIAAVINQFVPPDRRLNTLRSVVSTLLTEAGVPQPQTAAERVVQEAAQMMAGGGAQIAAARAIPQAAMLATAPGAQLAGAAGAGGAAQSAAEAGAGPGAQLAAGLAGGAVAGLAPGLQRVPGQTSADIQAARDVGVRVLTSDVRPPTTAVGRTLERAGEAIPLTGTTRVRTAQQQERVRAVDELLQSYNYQPLVGDLPDALTADLLAKRSADLKRLTGVRDGVLNTVSPTASVPLSNTMQVIRDEIAKLAPGTGTPAVDRVINDLTELGTRLQGRDLRGLEIERRVLRDQYADPALANIKSIGEPSLNRIYGSLVNDMGDFIKANGKPNDYNKWRSSTAELGEMARELHSTALKSVLRRGEVTPEVITNALFSGRPSDAKLVVKGLTPQGKEIAKAAVLRRAAESATALDERGAAQTVDPTKFAAEVQKLGGTIGVVFSPQETRRIEALTRVLNLTRRAEEAGAPVRVLGQQIPVGIPQAVGLTTVGTPVMTYLQGLLGPYPGAAATAGTAFTIGALARAYESAPVRNLLDRISTTKPGSAAEAQLVTALSALRIPAPEPQQ